MAIKASGPIGSTNTSSNWELNLCIPCKDSDHREARLVHFDREAYRQRSAVECLIGWLKESRRILSRFEKTAGNFSGMLKMAFIQQFLRYIDQNRFETEPTRAELIFRPFF
jgi:hypothetical protein